MGKSGVRARRREGNSERPEGERSCARHQGRSSRIFPTGMRAKREPENWAPLARSNVSSGSGDCSRVRRHGTTRLPLEERADRRQFTDAIPDVGFVGNVAIGADEKNSFVPVVSRGGVRQSPQLNYIGQGVAELPGRVSETRT